MAQVFPDFVGTTTCQGADCGLVGNASTSPTYTLTLPFKFFGYLVAAMQELNAQLTALSDTVSKFADYFTTRELTFTRATGDDLTVKRFRADNTATDELCLTDAPNDPNPLCLTKPQLAALLSQSGTASVANPTPAPTDTEFANPTPDSADDASAHPGTTAPTEPPTIEIQGNNPAHLNVGDTYNDLGARITGPTQADTNLGIKTFLNGALVSNIVLATTAPATDTIDYVATNAAGTSTSTRTVIIEPAAAASVVASTTSATSSAQ